MTVRKARNAAMQGGFHGSAIPRIILGRSRRARLGAGNAAASFPRVEPLVPPHRLRHGMGDALGVGMRRVDQKVVLEPRRNRRHDQQCRALVIVPSLRKRLAYRLVARVPARVGGGLEDFVGDAVRNRDLDEMLVGGHHQIGVNQLFQHRGGIVLGGIDHRTGARIPAPRIEPCPLRVIDRKSAFGVADAIASENAIAFLHAQTPPP